MKNISIDNLKEFLVNTSGKKNLLLGGRINHKSLYNPEYCKKLNLEIKKLDPDKIYCLSFHYAYLYYKYNILDTTNKIYYIHTYSLYFTNENLFNNYNFMKKYKTYATPKFDILQTELDHIINLNPDTIFGISYGSELKLKPNSLKINTENVYLIIGSTKDSYRKIVPNNNNITIDDYLKNNYEKTYNCTEGFFIIDNFVKNDININLIGFSTFGSNENTNEEIKDYLHNMKTTERQDIESDILYKLVKNNNINCLEQNII